MTDIVERLRDGCNVCGAAQDGADEIERLQSEIDKIKEQAEDATEYILVWINRDLNAEIESLHQLLTHARAELGEYIDWQYRHRADYPDEMRRYKRDMSLCYEIDRVLEENVNE